MQKGLDFTGVCVVYFCHDGQGNFVMAKRNQNARDEFGRWDIGGGALEFDDTVEGTLKKEIMEEYTAEVLDFKFLGYRDVHREHQGAHTHWVALDFKVLVNPNKVSLGEPDKFTEIAWFTLNNLPDAVHSQLPLFLEKYKEQL